MSYTSNQHCENIDAKIPLTAENIKKLIEECGGISLDKDYCKLNDNHNPVIRVILGNGEYNLCGTLRDDMIVLNKEQDGDYCNCDSGMEFILKTFKGSGTIEESGENGEHSITKFVDGKEKRGRVVFD
jgi:hypothetical protein